jgi:hemolysin activation/secretion protein
VAVPQPRIELAEQSFVLAGVLIEGATVYPNLDFLPFYERYLGQRVTVAELRAVADAITRRYQDDGYFLSSAFLPAQSIEFGVVRIRIVEGYVRAWRFTDAGAAADPRLSRVLRPILEQRPSRKPDLLATLRRLGDFPDLSVTPDLRPLADEPGAYELVLGVKRRRYDGSVSIDNRGSEENGPVRDIAVLRVFDLAGRHESYQLKLATASRTEELGYADASTEWRVGDRGLKLQLVGTYVTSRPGGTLAPLDVRVINRRARLGFSYPLERRPDREQTVSGYVDRYHSRTDVLGTRRLEDRLTTVNAAYRRLWGGLRSVQSLSASLTRGLSLGGSETTDAVLGEGVGEPEFTKLQLSYVGRYVLSDAWETSVSLDGQYAADELPSSERYSVGGSSFGSAYDPSEISGDHGLAGRIELRRANWRLADAWWLVPFAAYDVGAVWPAHGAVAARASAASLTLGVRATAQRLSLSLEIARPLTRPVASRGDDGKEPRVFASAGWWF